MTALPPNIVPLGRISTDGIYFVGKANKNGVYEAVRTNWSNVSTMGSFESEEECALAEMVIKTHSLIKDDKFLNSLH